MTAFASPAVLACAALVTAVAPSATASPSQAPRPAPSGARPAAAKQDPAAQRLCDLLHTLPAERKRECCGTAPPSLAAVCTQELSASLRRGAVALDAAAVEQCAARTARQLEGCGWVTPLTPERPAVCREAIRGLLRAGATCRSALECGDGLSCRGVSPQRPGVCAAPAPAGARCAVPADNLAAFTGAREDERHPVCDGLCLKGTCLAFAPEAGACQSSAWCGPDVNCVGGRCRGAEPPKLGESCAGGTSCGPGAFCQAGQCAPLKDAGATCSQPHECRAFECVRAPGGQAGRCGDPCGGGRAPKPSASAY
jgi:hypothetical protein